MLLDVLCVLVGKNLGTRVRELSPKCTLPRSLLPVRVPDADSGDRCSPLPWALGRIGAASLPVAIPGLWVPASRQQEVARVPRGDMTHLGGAAPRPCRPRFSTVPSEGGDVQARTDKPASPVQAVGRSIPNPQGANKGQVFVGGPGDSE